MFDQLRATRHDPQGFRWVCCPIAAVTGEAPNYLVTIQGSGQTSITAAVTPAVGDLLFCWQRDFGNGSYITCKVLQGVVVSGELPAAAIDDGHDTAAEEAIIAAWYERKL